MERQYATEYYTLERNHWWFLVREKILMQCLRAALQAENCPRDILNIGAATGRTSEALSQLGHVTSVEYDPVLCQFLNEELKIPAIQASITELPFPDQSFDVVCAFDVLEHVEDDRQAAAELARVCRPGGTVLVTVPAFQMLWSEHDRINHHFRRYRSGQLDELFRPLLQLEYASYFNSLLFLPVWLYRWISRMLPRKNSTSSGSDFEAFSRSSWTSRLLYGIFSMETHLLQKIRFPVGVSLVHQYRKS